MVDDNIIDSGAEFTDSIDVRFLANAAQPSPAPTTEGNTPNSGSLQSIPLTIHTMVFATIIAMYSTS